jgi:hypothetical protein
MKVLDMYCDRGWQTDVKELAGFIFYGIGITVPVMAKGSQGEYEMDTTTLWRWDTGARIEDNKADNMYEQAGKSAASDAFKRAAVQWGVGRFLYDLDTVSLSCDNYNVLDDRGQKVWDLTKHINTLKGKLKAPIVAEVANKLPVLSQESLDKMLAYITDGKISDVEKAMSKYTMTNAQKVVLTSLINKEKSKAVTAAVKKKS